MVPQTQFITSLDSFVQDLGSHFRSINRGGCGVVAYAIHQHISKYVPANIKHATYRHLSRDIDGRIKSLDKLRPDDKMAAQMIHCWFANDLPPLRHIFVEFFLDGQRYFVDTTGVHEVEDDEISFDGDVVLDGSYDPHEMAAFNTETNGLWNQEFNRNQVPDINSVIRGYFGVYVSNGVTYEPISRIGVPLTELIGSTAPLINK